ncbi:MAG: phage integrase N-terminal SAM-like domain-containing protein [Enterobacterales bacterium]|nr:phage integrase N-terminal SAM-like domain-containing protein [Enterobacterales bacterium]
MLPLIKVIAHQSPQVQIQQLVDALYQFMEQSSIAQNRARCYIQWMLQLSRFHNFQHPSDLCQSDIETYLSSLAIDGSYSPQTQQQAVNAFYFLYEHFLQIPLPNLRYSQIKNRRSFNDRFGAANCQKIVALLKPTSRLIAELALLGKLKLPQVVKLRLADVDIKANRIAVRDAQGKTAFCLAIPLKLILDLRIQLMRVKQSSNEFAGLNNLSNSKALLFPLMNQANNSQSSRSMLLLLVKNDIKIAIANYAQQNQQKNRKKVPQVLSRSLLGGLSASSKLYRASTRLEKESINKDRQIAFQLDTVFSQAQQYKRGAA